MRTLHADLTAAQVSASSTPFVRMVFHSLDRATTRTYDTNDSPNRVLQVQQSEGRYGSYTLVEGKPYSVSSVIRLQNNDAALSGLDFKGYRVYIEWGFNTVSGDKTSRSGPETVVSQELVSDKGISYLELFTLNLWERVNQVFVNVGNVLSLSWIKGESSETKVSHILMELLGGGELDGVLEDALSWTNYTTAAKTSGSTVELFPTSPIVNDAVYFGKVDKFDRISVDITKVPTSGSFTMVWEYSKGAGVWGTLSPLTQSEGATANSHLDLEAGTGIKIEAFDVPADWATDTVNGVGAYYWARARIDSISTPAGPTEADLIFAGMDVAFALDTTDAGQGDDYLPSYTTNVNSQVGRVVGDLLSYTLLGIRLLEDGFHAAFVDNAQTPVDETYDLAGPHGFFVNTESQGVVIPNRVAIVSGDISSGPATYSGVSNDAASQAEIGVIPRVEIRHEITSDADALALAVVRLSQLSRDVIQGRVEVPMHVGQEVWDLVKVTDARTGRSPEGRVSQIIRLYRPGTYIMQAIMGGSIYAVSAVPELPPGFMEHVPEPVITLPPIAPAVTAGGTVLAPTPAPTPLPEMVPVPKPVPTLIPVPMRMPGRVPTPPPTPTPVPTFTPPEHPTPLLPPSVAVPTSRPEASPNEVVVPADLTPPEEWLRRQLRRGYRQFRRFGWWR